MEAVRATRACEGLYSDVLDNTDTHRLALQSLNSLPGFPAELRIEVRDYAHDGLVRDSIGQLDAPIVKTLVRAEDGTYQVYQDSKSVPGDFYQGLFQALPQAQRNALSPSIANAQALKLHIAEHALNQPALRKLFAKNPTSKTVLRSDDHAPAWRFGWIPAQLLPDAVPQRTCSRGLPQPFRGRTPVCCSPVTNASRWRSHGALTPVQRALATASGPEHLDK